MTDRYKYIFRQVIHATIALLTCIVSFVGVIFLSLNITYHSTNVYGHSMLPTLNSSVESINAKGDLVLISKYKTAQAGDIITASPKWSSRDVIKRLVGTPGDTVKIVKTDKYELYCNNTLLYTRDFNANTNSYYDVYSDYLALQNKTEINLGEDEYFIMGDNWGNTSDSVTNRLSPISHDDIIGKVDLVVDAKENKFFAILRYGLEALFSII